MSDFDDKFKSEDDCLNFLKELRWPNGAFSCPSCGSDRAGFISKRNLMQCSRCRRQTSVTAGTIFHGCRLPLLKLFKLIWKFVSEPASSTSAIAREMEMNFSTAWVWIQKVRLILPEAQGDRVNCSHFEPILFRRSLESQSDWNHDATQEVAQHKADPQSEYSADDDSARSNLLDQVQAFVSQVFGGISRKYLQIYLSQWQMQIDPVNSDQPIVLLTRCQRSCPITRKTIRAFHSELEIAIPILT